MFPYLFLFGYFAVGALLERARGDDERPSGLPMLFLGGVLVALLIGFRYKIGADWQTYEIYFRYAGYADLDRLMQLSDPAYQFTNWFIQQLGLGIWGVNLICGAIFAWGLVRFARVQPEPWLTLLVAVPYLIVVVAMGYSRQAVAIGILLAGLAVTLRGGSPLRFAAYVLVAALFHKTAVMVLPLVLFAGERNRLLMSIAGLAVFVLIYDAVLANSVDSLIKNYIEAEYNSQGAVIRVGMSVIAALVFFWRSDRFGFSLFEQRVWRYFALASLALLVLLFVLKSSTAVDRMALYTIPLQLAVLSRIPIAFPQAGSRLAVVLYSLAVLLVWLNFAAHADYWVPYRFYPLS